MEQCIENNEVEFQDPMEYKGFYGQNFYLYDLIFQEFLSKTSLEQQLIFTEKNNIKFLLIRKVYSNREKYENDKYIFINRQLELSSILKILSQIPFFLKFYEHSIQEFSKLNIIVSEFLMEYIDVFKHDPKEISKEFTPELLFDIFLNSAHSLYFCECIGITFNRPLLDSFSFSKERKVLKFLDNESLENINLSIMNWKPQACKNNLLNPPEIIDFLESRSQDKSSICHMKFQSYTWGIFTSQILENFSFSSENFTNEQILDQNNHFNTNDPSLHSIFKLAELVKKCKNQNPEFRPSIELVFKEVTQIKDSIKGKEVKCYSDQMNPTVVKHELNLNLNRNFSPIEQDQPKIESSVLNNDTHHLNEVMNHQAIQISTNFSESEVNTIKSFMNLKKHDNSSLLKTKIENTEDIFYTKNQISKVNILSIKKRNEVKYSELDYRSRLRPRKQVNYGKYSEKFAKIKASKKNEKKILVKEDKNTQFEDFFNYQMNPKNCLYYLVEGIPMLLHLKDVSTNYTKIVILYNNHSRIDCERIDSEIICCGGYHDEQYLKTAVSIRIVFNDDRNQLRQLSNMVNEKTNHSLLNVNNIVYSIGGWIGNNINDCEKYDILTDSWFQIPDLNFPDSSITVCQIENRIIFTLGGFTSNEIEKIDTWT